MGFLSLSTFFFAACVYGRLNIRKQLFIHITPKALDAFLISAKSN